MSKTRLATLLAVLAMGLLLVGPVLAQDAEPSVIPDPPEPPSATAGLYITSEDNENNAHTGEADDDMGLGLFWMCPDYTPIEFNIFVDQEICSGGELGLMAHDFETGLHEVYLNGDFLGLMPDISGTDWVGVLFQVPQASIKGGANLVEIELVGGDCGAVAWGALAIDPCEVEEEFVPEPGTMILLASGLMGMAGYAGLRLRKK